MGVAGIVAPGSDPESACSLGQRGPPCTGSEGAAADVNHLSSVTRTPVKTVWLRVSSTLIFIPLCLLIASNYSLSTLAWKLSLRLNLKKLRLIAVGAMPTVRC